MKKLINFLLTWAPFMIPNPGAWFVIACLIVVGLEWDSRDGAETATPWVFLGGLIMAGISIWYNVKREKM